MVGSQVCFSRTELDLEIATTPARSPITSTASSSSTPGLPSTDKSLLDLLRWKLFSKPSPLASDPFPRASGLKPDPRVEGLRITAIGHSSMLIQVAGINILVDPVWSDRTSPFNGLALVATIHPPSLSTTCHPSTPSWSPTTTTTTWTPRPSRALWQAHKPAVISPLGNDAVIRKDAPDVQVQTGDWWQSFSLSDQVRATIVPAYHWSARNLGDRRFALWGGFILEPPPATSTALATPPIRMEKSSSEIRERCRPASRRHPSHRRLRTPLVHEDPAHRPRGSMQIAIDLGAQHLLGVHWATFQLTDEPWDEPAKLLESAVRDHTATNIKAQALRPGDIWESASA